MRIIEPNRPEGNSLLILTLAATVYLTPSPELIHAASAVKLLQGSRCFPGLALIADFDPQGTFTRLTAPSPESVTSYAVSGQTLFLMYMSPGPPKDLPSSSLDRVAKKFVRNPG